MTRQTCRLALNKVKGNRIRIHYLSGPRGLNMNGGVSGILYKSDNMKRGDLQNFPVLNVIAAGT